MIITTKRAQVFVLERATGEPIKAVEELPVPEGDGSNEGEYYSPWSAHRGGHNVASIKNAPCAKTAKEAAKN